MAIGLHETARRLAEETAHPADSWLGRVSRVDRTSVRALDQALNEYIVPRTAALNVLVGDWVWLSDATHVRHVVGIAPRYSVLTRTRSAADSQPVATNVDVALLVIAQGEAHRPGVIERLALAGWESGATPHFVVTKADLADPGRRAEILTVLAESAPGIDATLTSSTTGEGIARLRDMLDGDLSAVMLGHSGVGKSSLANSLVCEHVFATGPVRRRDGKGRQTTTARTITPLPGGAGALIDTPGIRELGVSLNSSLEDVFVEIDRLARHCRFGDCSHRNDAGCAVREAVQRQAISADRYERYLTLNLQQLRADRRAGPPKRDRATEYARLARQYRRMRGY